MRITRVEVIPVALPFREPYVTAYATLHARTTILVRVHTDETVAGVGEAVPLTLRGGQGAAEVSTELAELCGPAIAGVSAEPLRSRSPADIRRWIWELLERCRRQRAGRPALCGIDIALHDLAGKVAGLPVWRLLGATRVHEVICNASIDAREPDAAGAAARIAATKGFTTHKVKVGTGSDAERVAAVRTAIGHDAHIRIDANGAWDTHEAVRRLHELQGHGIELAEQPGRDLAALTEIRARSPIPVIADESVASLEEAQAAGRQGACDAATIKLSKVGGPLEAIRVAGALPAYLSSALDGPIGIAAAVHTAQVMPRGGYAARLAHGLATLEMFERSYAPTTGLCGPRVTPPRAPGIGVEIDELALNELRVP